MTADNLTVAGRRFRTRADYEAALRDQKKIEAIKEKTDFSSPGQLYRLFGELQAGIYRFESAVGNDFDDEIYEKIEQLKQKGITAENAADYIKGSNKIKTSKTTGLKTKNISESNNSTTFYYSNFSISFLYWAASDSFSICYRSFDY